MGEKIDAFQEQRLRMNERILATGTLQTQRFWNLDTRVYEAGALPVRTKEMMGLVASMVLRCDDCITYHPIRAPRSSGSSARRSSSRR
jgi:AhpD family alkylhydroperoxidase